MAAQFNADEVLAFAIDLARRAGKVILDGSAKRFRDQDSGNSDFEEILKKNTADLVTETDQATEKLIKDAIQAKYPNDKFIGEESWAAGDEAKLTDETTWIIDPIDGTTNFVIGLPSCCVSIGVAHKSRPVVGVIYAPFLDHLFYAKIGGGAWFETGGNKRQLPLSRNPLPLPSLQRAVGAMEYGNDRSAETIKRKMDAFARLAGDPAKGVKDGRFLSGIRSIGSAALSCCYVAQGSLDFWHEIGCWAWDVCAGIVIVQEAGGVALGSKAATVKSLDSPAFGDVTPEILQGRKFLIMRSIGSDKSTGESGRDAQKRIAKDFYDAIGEEWNAA